MLNAFIEMPRLGRMALMCTSGIPIHRLSRSSNISRKIKERGLAGSDG
jgi:hypothetical protein